MAKYAYTYRELFLVIGSSQGQYIYNNAKKDSNYVYAYTHTSVYILYKHIHIYKYIYISMHTHMHIQQK